MTISVPLRISAFSFLICGAALAQDGAALFQANCATCHSAGSTAGAPLPETLRQMPAKAILAALESGKMRAIGEPLNAGTARGHREVSRSSVGSRGDAGFGALLGLSGSV
jgi:cytochrome c553